MLPLYDPDQRIWNRSIKKKIGAGFEDQNYVDQTGSGSKMEQVPLPLSKHRVEDLDPDVSESEFLFGSATLSIGEK